MDSLVLVHGLSASGRWWRKVVPLLAERLDVHVVDLPGDYTVATAPELLVRRLDDLGLQRVHLAGHSLGGLVAARVAARLPERVDRLVLVAPAGLAMRSSWIAYAPPLARLVVSLRPRFAAILVSDALRAGPHRLLRIARELLADSTFAAELAEVHAPTLLVWGERDRLVPPRVAELFLAALPDARVQLVPGAGHVPMEDAPREVAAAILAHLARREPEPSSRAT